MLIVTTHSDGTRTYDAAVETGNSTKEIEMAQTETPQGNAAAVVPAAQTQPPQKAAAASGFVAQEDITFQQFLDVALPRHLPPIFSQFVSIAPEMFKEAVVLSLLPLLGTVGSRLRGKYINERWLSPTFMVVLVGEQGCGKSFIDDVAQYVLKLVDEADEHGRAQRDAYEKLMKKLSKANVKVTVKNAAAELPDEPKPIVRIITPKVTMPALFKAMANNRDLHSVTVAQEIGIVINSLGSTHGDISYLLCQAFDNTNCGQLTAGDTSFSGKVNMYYNVLYSGTEQVVAQFFNDKNMENGLMSRFFIYSLPYDPFVMPEVWGRFTAKQEREVQKQLARLNDITVCKRLVVAPDGSEEIVYEAMPEYEMQMPWLNAYLKDWESTLLRLAQQTNNRPYALFHKRAMTAGFRAGMLAWYLFGQKRTSQVKEAVCQFARWVATQMLNNLVENYKPKKQKSKIDYPTIFNMLPERFTWDDVDAKRVEAGHETPTRTLIFRWKAGGVIDCVSNVKPKAYVKRRPASQDPPAGR